jgi:hypothetical protein
MIVDHVTVAGRSLQKMQAHFSSLGIPSDYGGQHSNRATEMAVISFPDGSYLELIAIQADADPEAVKTHPWARFLEHDAGPCAWAVRCSDTGTEVSRLKDAGVDAGGVVRGGRLRPDGVRLEWETAQVGAEGNGTFFPFLIRDVTPRKARVYPKGKPSAKKIAEVAKVVIAVRDLESAVKRYRQAYGLPAPIKQVDPSFGAQLALLGGTPVVLAAPLNSQSWLAARLEQFGEAPCAFVLSSRARYPTRSKTTWFGKDVSWLDLEALGGWHVGIE